MARKLVVEIVGDASSLQRAFGDAGDHSNKLGSALTGLAKTGVLAAGAAGVGALFVTLKAGLSEFIDSAKVAAQTNAVIKSTGGVAHETAGQVDKLGSSIQAKSGIDDEAVKVGANMLLTFTNIRNEVGKGNDIFAQTAKVVTDMDVAMTHGNVTAESMSKMAILVGKALNDPIKGMGALRRVGVSLTQDQQDQVKALLDTGYTATEIAKIRTAAEKKVQQASKASEVATAAVKTAQDSLAAASDALRTAQESLVGAHQREVDASHALKTATEAVTAAKARLLDTQKSARQAQIDLTRAREDAARTLLDLRDAAVDAKLGEESASIRLQRAQENLLRVMADSTATDLDKREALLGVKEAGQSYAEAERKSLEATDANTAAQKQGVEGLKSVVDAKNNVINAHKAEQAAAKAVSDAQYAVQHAYQGVENAQRGVAGALRAVGKATATQHADQEKLTKALSTQHAATEALAAAQNKSAAAQKLQVQSAASASNMLKAQKIILGELNKEFGGSAKAMGETVPGQLSILRERFNNFAGDLVGKSIPVIQEMIGWLKDHWPEINARVQAAVAAILPVLQSLADLFMSIVTVVRDNWGTIGPIVEAVGKVAKDALKVVADAIKLVADLLRGDWSAAWDDAKNLVTAWSDGVKTEIATAATALGDAAAALGRSILDGITSGMTGLANLVGNKLSEAAGAIGFDNAYNRAVALGSRIVDGVVSGVTGIATAVAQKVQAVVDAIGGFFDNIYNKASALGGRILDGVVAGVTGIATAVGNKIQAGIDAIDGFVASAIAKGKSLGGVLRDGFIEGLSGIGTLLVRIFKKAINAVIGVWNDFHIPAVKVFGHQITPEINFPNIPLLPVAMAAGGIVTGPTLALIGERGPEAVVPLGRGGGGGANHYHFHFPNLVATERSEIERIVTAAVVRANRRGNLLASDLA